MFNNLEAGSSVGSGLLLPQDVAKEGNDTSIDEDSKGIEWVPLDTSIGLILAFSSCFFIGISVIYKKLALRDLQANGGTRAVDGGYGYLKIKKWWFGITLMGLGELTNFVAYIFAPAILVTPLGVFSIVCTATLSPYFLKERLNSVGRLGCLLVLVGCVMVTLCGPKDREVSTMAELQSQLLNPGFLIYSALVVGTSAILMALVPKFGHKYVMLYITICSSFGSLSVMFCKGVGLALKQTYMGTNEFTQWPTWVCIVCLVSCLVIETIYMQRALDLFNSSVFMSVNYVLFTSLVIIASSILYTELRELGWKNILLTILGFVVNIAALYLLHLDKEEPTLPFRTDELSAINSPDQDPVTPLMANTNNNDKPQNVYGKEIEKNSPLSNIKLSPSLIKESSKKSKNILSFIKRESATPLEQSMERSSSSDSITTYGSNESDSLSTKSNHSSLCSVVEGALNECLREVPLITQLHSSSSRMSGSCPPTEEVDDTSHDKNLSHLSNAGHPDVDESTQLV